MLSPLISKQTGVACVRPTASAWMARGHWWSWPGRRALAHASDSEPAQWGARVAGLARLTTVDESASCSRKERTLRLPI